MKNNLVKLLFNKGIRKVSRALVFIVSKIMRIEFGVPTLALDVALTRSWWKVLQITAHSVNTTGYLLQAGKCMQSQGTSMRSSDGTTQLCRPALESPIPDSHLSGCRRPPTRTPLVMSNLTLQSTIHTNSSHFLSLGVLPSPEIWIYIFHFLDS